MCLIGQAAPGFAEESSIFPRRHAEEYLVCAVCGVKLTSRRALYVNASHTPSKTMI
jgi:hypothetical protein